MIVDASALVAIVLGEEGRDQLLSALLEAESVRISTATAFETLLVIDDKRNFRFNALLNDLIDDIAPKMEPVTASQVPLARTAYQVFGKKSGSKARLNFGDCFSYALAIETDEPLLFKGYDFNHTDVRIDERSVIVRPTGT